MGGCLQDEGAGELRAHQPRVRARLWAAGLVQLCGGRRESSMPGTGLDSVCRRRAEAGWACWAPMILCAAHTRLIDKWLSGYPSVRTTIRWRLTELLSGSHHWHYSNFVALCPRPFFGTAHRLQSHFRQSKAQGPRPKALPPPPSAQSAPAKRPAAPHRMPPRRASRQRGRSGEGPGAPTPPAKEPAAGGGRGSGGGAAGSAAPGSRRVGELLVALPVEVLELICEGLSLADWWVPAAVHAPAATPQSMSIHLTCAAASRPVLQHCAGQLRSGHVGAS